MLDDALDALLLAGKAEPNYVAMWIDFAETNIQRAAHSREKVKAAVDKFGGPEHIIEMGGYPERRLPQLAGRPSSSLRCHQRPEGLSGRERPERLMK